MYDDTGPVGLHTLNNSLWEGGSGDWLVKWCILVTHKVQGFHQCFQQQSNWFSQVSKIF